MSSSGSAEPGRTATPDAATPHPTPTSPTPTSPTPTSPTPAHPSPGGAGDTGTGRLAPQRRPRPIFLVVGIAAAVVLAAVLVVVSGHRGGPTRPQAGGAVPAFTLPRLGATGTVSVPGDGGSNGRPAVLLFFASWCTPCQGEIPALAAAYRQQRSEGSRLATVALVGVDGNDPTRSALAFVHRSGVTFPVGVDHSYSVTAGKFDFTGLPESVMVYGNGTIAAIHYGALSRSDLVRWEHRLLAGPR